ncbi:hypothetical protein BVC80_1831g315 [Macleaya cordata]|uniref:Uncharacterized protein n=1 Tax=Macleaya cordata TaxID=56857 RepID=A0A200R7Q5_MACCD|nr:hypothetical protein BVC80_1831g315 [Macleaya cordata]
MDSQPGILFSEMITIVIRICTPSMVRHNREVKEEHQNGDTSKGGSNKTKTPPESSKKNRKKKATVKNSGSKNRNNLR